MWNITLIGMHWEWHPNLRHTSNILTLYLFYRHWEWTIWPLVLWEQMKFFSWLANLYCLSHFWEHIHLSIKMVEKFYILGNPAIFTNLHNGRYFYIDSYSWDRLDKLGVFPNCSMFACLENLQKPYGLWGKMDLYMTLQGLIRVLTKFPVFIRFTTHVKGLQNYLRSQRFCWWIYQHHGPSYDWAAEFQAPTENLTYPEPTMYYHWTTFL
jgi:hypothetical protein